MGKIKDLTGQKFGKLTVIEKTDKRINRCVVWKCKCECGNICEIKSNNLLTGHTTSCGCSRTEKCREVGKRSKTIDEIGNRYGKLTVLQFNRMQCYNNNQLVAMWECQCDCGNKVVVAGTHLRSGHTTSCGCIKSRGEEKIIQLLIKNNIPYQKEYTVFINNSYYRYDFAILDKNNIKYLIEFDGPQHNEISDYFGGEQKLKTIQFSDKIKNKWCKENNIPLIRIPYSHLQDLNINDLLLETTKFQFV